MSAEFQVIDLEIPRNWPALALDSALARLLPEHSRTRIKGWIDAGQVKVGRLPCKPRDVVNAGSRVQVHMTAEALPAEVCPRRCRSIGCTRTRDVRCSTSRPGWWCIPAPAIRSIRCKMPCLAWDPSLATLPRAGIVHRLDKDTSGLLVIARTPEAHTSLTRQLAARSVSREYLAVCVGVMTGGGTIDAAHRPASQRPAADGASAGMGGRPSRIIACSSASAPIPI